MTLTDDRQALLNSIIANPDDDAPRLIYADWLEEQDIPNTRVKAQFLRHQFASEAVVIPLIVLTELEQFLEGKQPHQCSRQGYPDYSVAQYELSSLTTLIYRRGFIDEIHCTMQQWLDHGKDIVRQHPVTKVMLTDRAPLILPLVSDSACRWCCNATRGEINSGDVERYQLWHKLKWSLPNLSDIFYSQQDANAALSRACLEWARA